MASSNSRAKRSLVQANVRGSRGTASPTRVGRVLEEMLCESAPNPKSTKSTATSTTAIAVNMSPYMLFHGEPSRMWGGDVNSNQQTTSSSSLSPTGRRGSTKSAANDEEELPATSPFRSGDLGAALFASAAAFTGGQAIKIIHDVVERSQQQSRLRGGVSDGFSLPSLSPGAPSPSPSVVAAPPANLASLHRLLVSCAVREASKVIAKQQESQANSMNNVNFANALYARAGTEIRIASFVRLLRDDYDIRTKPLLDALTEGLNRVNERLVDERGVSVVLVSSKTFPAAVPGAIPIAALVELLHLYVNDAFAVATRQACFNDIDVGRMRVITMAQLRALRGLKEHVLRQKTERCGSFSMVKALLDMFQQNCSESGGGSGSSTITMEQLSPWFDVDDGRLVEGFLEEILRQIVVQEFNCSRSSLLSD